MIKLRGVLLLVMAFAWAPITWHCGLEVLPILDFLACCDHEEESAAHQDDDCEQDGCAVVESGNYKTQEQQVFVAPPQIARWWAELVAPRPIDQLYQEIPATSPPEDLRTWQFVVRAALPVRAPSFAS